MDTIVTTLFSIALYPFTSQTFFVVIPCCLCSVGACFALMRRLMGGSF